METLTYSYPEELVNEINEMREKMKQFMFDNDLVCNDLLFMVGLLDPEIFDFMCSDEKKIRETLETSQSLIDDFYSKDK